MRDAAILEKCLAEAMVDAEVFELRPDYRSMLIAVDGLTPASSDSESDAVLTSAEASAREALSSSRPEDLPHVAAWREAYIAFGAKPQRTRNSLEALLRRVDAGLPRINRLTDTYNAISIRYQIPLGGEDLDGYLGAPRLIRATGNEQFDTVANGDNIVEHPEPGEVVWCDEEGVTCRRWNWRQGRRTALSERTTAALFILDALAPMPDEALASAANELLGHLVQNSPELQVAQRVISASVRG